jgi:hypothetical protein
VDHIYMLWSLTACLEADLPIFEGYFTYFRADAESISGAIIYQKTW